MSHVGLSEHDHNLNSVSSQCARGKPSISRKPESHPIKINHLDFKFYLGKLNNKYFPIWCNVDFVSVFNAALNNTKKQREYNISPY